MLDVNKCYKRSENVIIRKLGEKQWALDMKSGSEYVINDVSYDILDMLSVSHSISEIVSCIVDRYDISKETFLNDLETWLPTALEKGLMEKVPKT